MAFHKILRGCTVMASLLLCRADLRSFEMVRSTATVLTYVVTQPYASRLLY